MTQMAQHPPFANEAIYDFADDQSRMELQSALERARQGLGRRYPLIIDGIEHDTATHIASINPARPQEIVGEVSSASLTQAQLALQAAGRAFQRWSSSRPADRAQILFDAAERIRRERARFNALLVLEVGKPWIEADADTAEAIDFLEFYAREALRYANPPALVQVPHERNHLTYLPLGIGIIIPPWNFAFAIMAGMTAAALVTGNTVIVKPSSDAAVIAYEFVKLLHEVNLPAGVVNFLPGSGREIGDPLVLDPQTRFIAFTGSKAVGLRINELAARPQKGQLWIKRVIAEMGGKDAIIVADDADLDAAADGIVASAYGFSGQKCSACSRLIVDAKVYDALLERLIPRIQALRVGDPSSQLTQVGPVINATALATIRSYIQTGMQEGRLVCGGMSLEKLPTEADPAGFYLPPTLIVDCKPTAKIVAEEIFGPVLAMIKASDFEEALALANTSEYGLTGAVYATDRRKLDLASEQFFVGNLYLNRKCTGALVGVHPFGGFNMSGTDSKAGGYDYLGLFLQAKVISEKAS